MTVQLLTAKLISVSEVFSFSQPTYLSDNEFLFAEKYTRGVSAVESILTLDRLRQSVAIKELEQTHGQPLSMRKTVSVPNFSQVCIANRNDFYFIFVIYHLGFCFIGF